MGRHWATFSELIAAWQRKDVDTVMSFLADDIVWHYAAPALAPVRGKQTAAKLLKRFQADMHDIQWRVFHHAESGDVLFLEGVDDYRTADGRRVATPYAGVIEFRGDLIVGWRDYVDLTVMQQLQAGGAMSETVQALIDREVPA